MSYEKIVAYFEEQEMTGRIKHFDSSCATVEEAANTIGVVPARIAKTLSLRKDEDCMLIVMAGDVGIDNKKFRHYFGMKARMLTASEVEEQLDQQVGGVCPFAVADHIPVYIDVSVKRFDTLFPACGSPTSVVELTPDELFTHGHATEWVDIAKLPVEQ
ncbi:YbaK/EbsC family protein [Paenibacillus sp. GCM10012306]|uniref:YbaK/EbsC family protein n=1 Tax=Paenibacillus sp. GCM10012306 TaxID=3317342 RepID=UPI00360E60B7